MKKKKTLAEEWKEWNKHDPLTYRVELEIKDTYLSESGLQCFLEHSLARELTGQQRKQDVTVVVKGIKRKK